MWGICLKTMFSWRVFSDLATGAHRDRKRPLPRVFFSANVTAHIHTTRPQPAPAWSWVTAWPGLTRREPPRRLSGPPDALATAHSDQTSVTRARDERREGARAAPPGTGEGDGGDSGSSGDAGDVGGRVAAAAALRDARARTCARTTGLTAP